MSSVGKDTLIRVKLFGFGGKNRMVVEVVVHSNVAVRDVVANIIKMLDLEVDYDEVMVLCNGVQVYLDDVLPNNCSELELFPLAFGG